jgi:geranylgeranyl diphosphate synthase type II
MDDDDTRRGKPSCHKAFGEATALLAGDALLANAFNTAAAAMFLPKSIKPQNAVSVVSAMSGAVMETIRGQQSDMDFERGAAGSSGVKLTEDDIIGMYNRKTCALISAACVSGAICANTNEKNIHKARSYGVALGLAFQLTDDLLDFDEDSGATSEKTTYATLFGKKKTKEKAWEYADSAVKIAGSFSGSAFLKELAIKLNERSD